MIFLVGPPQDTPVQAVRNALEQLGQPLLFFDQTVVLDAEVALRVDASVQGFFRLGPPRIVVETVTAMYLRASNFCHLPAIRQAGPRSRAWRHACNMPETLLSWAELTPALVVNPPRGAARNHAKPYQSALTHPWGFAIPATLLTTDPAAAQAFWEQYGTVIYKSLSGVRSIVARLTPAHRGRLADLATCPTQFQQYIPGHDYRVPVVGGE